MGIVIKSSRELAKMKEAGRIVMAVLDAVEAACVPGTTTGQLNRIAERELARAKARSAFLGYRPGGAPVDHRRGCSLGRASRSDGGGRSEHRPSGRFHAFPISIGTNRTGSSSDSTKPRVPRS